MFKIELGYIIKQRNKYKYALGYSSNRNLRASAKNDCMDTASVRSAGIRDQSFIQKILICYI